MNTETENLIKNNLAIVSRVVGREMARGVVPWVDRSDLEDVAQMALVEAAGKFRVGSCPFGAFAYREVRTAVLMELRRLRVRFRGRAEMPEHVDLQPEAAHRLELYDALAALPPRQYQAVMLTYWGGNRSIECATGDDTPSGMTLEQVGEEMGVSFGRVAQILRAAQKNLREALQNSVPQTRTWIGDSSDGAEQFAGVGQLTQVVQGVATTRPENLV